MKSDGRVMSGHERGSKVMKRLVCLFKRHGWKDLATSASPAYTDALLISPDGKRVAKFAERCEAWAEFAEWAARNPSPHLPLIEKFRRSKRSGLAYAVMERLHDLPYTGSAWYYKPRAGQREHTRKLIREAFQLTQWSDGQITLDREALTPTLRNTVAAMEGALGFPRDLHGKNMMVRKGPRGRIAELVLLDPYA